MDYISERIVNISELERKLERAYTLCSIQVPQALKEAGCYDSQVINPLREISEILHDATQFEFRLERRKVTTTQ